MEKRVYNDYTVSERAVSRVAHADRSPGVTYRRSKIGVVALAAVLVGLHFVFLQRHALVPAVADNRTSVEEFDWEALQPSKSLAWTPCYSAQKCARLLLPLDYDTPDGPTTAIAIRMIPANDTDNYRGTIFLNPGGPGGSGVDFVGRKGQSISQVVGPSFDVLSFDPRGIGRTTPAAVCFDSNSQSKIWETQAGHQFVNESAEALGILRARAQLLAERCEDRLGGEWGIGRHASTPNVAQDMLEISRLLGQEEIQYWGFSYGTILGQYFAGMYPDKIKRFVIDGVADAELLYRNATIETDFVNIEDVVDSLFTYCHQAGPEKCPIYDSSPAKIRERYFDILDQVKKNPVPVSLAEPPVVITYKTLVKQFFQATYNPLTRFGAVAKAIHAIETGNQTALVALSREIVDPVACECNPQDGSPLPMPVTEAYPVVECSDMDAPPYDPAAFAKVYGALAALSPLFAPMWAEAWVECAEWTMRPKRRWTGALAADETSHPLLVVSTRYDPVTPLAQARAVVRRFGGAALLTQESYGHCSVSSPSLCTAKHIRAYFVDGTLPEEGATCGVDELPFVGKTGDVRALSSEDEELLEAMRDLADWVPPLRV
ncbi:alpha/beta-hydrolase [Daedaleopsis nitida]|nr:alpha/beta-hydrolase [Daedaleopsis nitida]